MGLKNKGVKKPIYKRVWFWLVIVLTLFIIIGVFGSDDTTDEKESKTETTQEAKKEEKEEKKKEPKEEKEEKDEKDAEVTQEDLQKELSDRIGIIFMGDVNNDATGNWRLSEYASSESQETLALDYYKAYFKSDDEIHAVINMTNKVTASISVMFGSTLDVRLYEYVDGEEHDANELFGGMLLKEYFVDIATGDIEDVQ